LNCSNSQIDGAFVQNIVCSEDNQSAKMLEARGCDHLQGAFVGLASVERPWRPALVQTV